MPPHSKQLQRTVIPRRRRVASALFHHAHAARSLAQRAAVKDLDSHPRQTQCGTARGRQRKASERLEYRAQDAKSFQWTR